MGFTCPNVTEVEAVRRAIAEGTITWHAAPFNPQYEVRHQQYTVQVVVQLLKDAHADQQVWKAVSSCCFSVDHNQI
jgi:hypothetical protein